MDIRFQQYDTFMISFAFPENTEIKTRLLMTFSRKLKPLDSTWNILWILGLP